jgi:hypothetical protein
MPEAIGASPREATLALIEDLWRRAVEARPAEEIPARLHVGALAWEMLRASVAQRAGQPMPGATHMFGVPVVVEQPPNMTTLLPPRGWALISAAGTIMAQGVLGDG